MNNNTIIVDLQGFKNNGNEFIVKEFAIATQEHTHTFLVKPPYPFTSLSLEEKKQVRWIERNRGYRWSEGYVDYKEFHRIIKPLLASRKIIVKGQEKIKWVGDLCEHNNILDISYTGIPTLNALNDLYSNNMFNCIFHDKKCALQNVLCIKKWCYVNNKTIFYIKQN